MKLFESVLGHDVPPYTCDLRIVFTCFKGIIALPIFLLSALIGLIHANGLMLSLDNMLSGNRFRLIDRAPTGDIVVVDIDTKSIDAVARWPWPRSLYADLVDRLYAAGATDIAFDIDVSAASNEEEDAAFEQALIRASGSVILPIFTQKLTARKDESSDYDNIPINRFERVALTGTVNVPLDADGRVRSYYLGAMVNDLPVASFASVLTGLNGPVDGDFRIDFTIDGNRIAHFSAIDVLNGEIDPSRFHGKRVVIGSSAEELRDFFWVPGHALMPGAVLHGVAAETILQDRMLARTS